MVGAEIDNMMDGSMNTRMQDVFSILRGALGQAGRLVLDRGRQWYAGPDDVPADLAALNAQWLERVLKKHHPAVRIAAVSQLSADAGTTQRARLRVTYASPESAAGLPASFFVKLAPADARTRIFVNLFRLGPTEVQFYQQAAAAIPAERPAVYHAALSRGAERFVLILEDLAGTVQFRDTTLPATPEEARRVVEMLGRLHAAFWESPRLTGELGWLKSHEHNPTRSLERSIWSLAIKPGLEKFRELVPDAQLRAAGKLTGAFDQLSAACARGPRTLIHGDLHIGNLFFRQDKVGLFDWQCAQHGQGMRDLSYFICSSMPIRLRRLHERELLELYRHALGEAGVAELPSKEELWSQHRWHTLFTLGAMAITAAAANLQAVPIVRAALERTTTAVLDLDALELLESKS